MFLNLEIIFHFCMMMGVIIAMGSNNWFSMWLGLEMTLMSFIPIMSNKNKLNSESCIKYFIIQSLSSSVMMMGVIMMSMKANLELILMMSIMLKLGMSPFHTWMLSMIEGLNYYSIFILLTIMKIIPLTMISYMNANLNLMIMISLIVGAIAGLNQNSIKKMICYSSILNMAFTISCINNNPTWMSYFMIYSASLFLFILIVKKLNFLFVNQFIFNNYNSSIKMTTWLSLLSMGGFPPLMGFYGKMMVLLYMYKSSNMLTLTLMIMTSLITMFFYMRIIFLSMMFFNHLPSWMSQIQIKFNSFMLIASTLMPLVLFNLKSL
uniref:NADH dehydrogenase subunit 2 n=1 Tax=Centrotus cornutus TaxID=1585357 RepID=UPI00237BB83B|nr:NADH dehydrogenase subunit 2 [Centrotus cornutus]WBV77354.1 NADH dehydrogenase subunit 2 [Centrotus cornutus]